MGIESHLNKLEKQITKVKSALKEETRRLERLNSQLALTKDQLSHYSQESSLLKDKLKKSFDLFTKENCAEVRSIKAPVSALLELSSKVLMILGIKDSSWKRFRNITKDFYLFKALMSNAMGQQVREDIINEVLPLWKNQVVVRGKLFRITPAASVLFDWLIYLIELNVKCDIIENSQKRIPELEKRIKGQSKVLKDLGNEEEHIEGLLNSSKLDDESCDKDVEELSLTSKPYAFLLDIREDKHSFQATVHRGTASGGIMGKNENKHFPDFSSDFLYKEIPVQKGKCDNEILIESKDEKIGCCKMRFFCF